jgi:hypothetical protein
MRLAALLLAALPLISSMSAAIFPEKIAQFTRGTVTALKAPDRELYEELGFTEGEKAEYSGPTGKFSIAGWKVRDSTCALALFQMLRPADAGPSDLAKLAARTGNGVITAYGNFVLEYAGFTPNGDQLDELLVQLKNVERSALPTLIQFLPDQDLIPNSERYILGPVTLQRFAPQIPPSLAAFHLAAEAQQGRYRTPKGEITMTIFSYPAPNMARERHTAFLEVPGVVAKRSGSLVAVVYPPADPDQTQVVLGRVNYEFQVTRQRVGAAPAQGMANIVLTAFLLVGVLFASSLLAGIWLGGFKALFRRFGWYKETEQMTVLRIGVPTKKP